MKREQDEFSDMLQNLAESEFLAFCNDLRSDPQQSELLKSVKDARANADLEQQFGIWSEEMELAALGRSNPASHKRLRSADTSFLGDMEPPEDFGGPELRKRHQPMKGGTPNSVVCDPETGWTTIYDERGEVKKAFGPGASEADFERVKE